MASDVGIDVLLGCADRAGKDMRALWLPTRHTCSEDLLFLKTVPLTFTTTSTA